MAKKTSSPGRTLLVFFICTAALFGLAALGGTWKPRLGLDLEGGTRITLQSVGSTDATKMEQARNIIESRVNGSGATEAEVSTQGSKNIIVEIPGENRKDLVDSVKRTAQLRFRLVSMQPGPQSGIPLSEQTQSPSPSPSGTSTPSPTETPTTSPTPSSTTDPTESSSPRSRPAPQFAPELAPQADEPTPTAVPSDLPLPRATQCTGIPTDPTATKGKSRVDLLVAWAQSPPQDCQEAFATFVCPKNGDTGFTNDDPAKPLIACDADRNKYLLSQAVIEGTQLKSASAGIPQNEVSWAVELTLKGGQPRKDFADTSRALLANGGQFAIVLDGQVLSSPGFTGVIPDGKAQITGSFDEESATSLANSLKYGALPVKFDPNVTSETIGATLAGDQLSGGVLAGILGLIIVMIYCIFYYRGLSVVVITSLFVAAAITYATVLVLAQAAGFALTLPGLAGLIVAVGITADSFIVYFERIRDEMRDGKSMRVAVESAWIRARNTCLAADAVSLLAGIVLYIFAIGVVRGFAFALVISTIIDIIVFFWFTKPMVTLLARRPYFNNGGKHSGLSPATLGIDGPAESALVGGKA